MEKLETLIYIVFLITLISNSIVIGGLVITIFKKNIRIWPPPGKKSWQFWFAWIFTTIAYSGIILLGFLDWDSFVFSHWARYPIGTAFIIVGFVFLIWGIRTLSLHTSVGLKGTLITFGPYRYTRNPQYLGDILFFMGIIILSNSLFTAFTGILGIVWNILTPFAEEPWLRNVFGEQYEEYCKNVRRFI